MLGFNVHVHDVLVRITSVALSLQKMWDRELFYIISTCTDIRISYILYSQTVCIRIYDVRIYHMLFTVLFDIISYIQ